MQDHVNQLNSLLELQAQISGIHPLLDYHFPIGIAQGRLLTLFDVLSNRKYSYIQTIKLDFETSPYICAAFPIEEYNQQTVCVISKEVLESNQGKVIVFHEFVHCFQDLTCDQKLK